MGHYEHKNGPVRPQPIAHRGLTEPNHPRDKVPQCTAQIYSPSFLVKLFPETGLPVYGILGKPEADRAFERLETSYFRLALLLAK